jgi:hypothetical protein
MRNKYLRGIILRADYQYMIPASFGEHAGIIPKSCRHHPEIIPASSRNHSGIIPKSFRRHPGSLCRNERPAGEAGEVVRGYIAAARTIILRSVSSIMCYSNE